MKLWLEVAGIEPETPCATSPVTMQNSEFSPEALTEILTEISGADRQMLSQIVQRWNSLSDDLKRAVLREVRKCIHFLNIKNRGMNLRLALGSEPFQSL